MKTSAINGTAGTIRQTRIPNPAHLVLAAPENLVGGENRKTKIRIGATIPRPKKKKKAKAGIETGIGAGIKTETETGIEIVTVTVIRTAIGIETGIKTETETETTKSAPRVLARRNRRETRAKREKSGLTGRRRARVPEVRKKIRAEKLWCRPSISAAWAAVEMRRRPRLRLAASAPRNPPAEHLFPHPGVAISIGPSSPIRKRLRNG